MYVIVEISGAQFKVKKGETIVVPKLAYKQGEEVVFDKVLFLSDDDGIVVGEPHIKNVNVVGVVLDHFKDRKINVFRMGLRRNYQKHIGHRQQLSKVLVNEITYQR